MKYTSLVFSTSNNKLCQHFYKSKNKNYMCLKYETNINDTDI